MCRYFSGLIQQDNIADRQAVAMIIHGLSTVEFLIHLLQQFRLRNAALSDRKIATVENLVIINTVYERIKIGTADAILGTSNNGGRTGYVLVWEKDGISHTIIGKIPREEILKIAESIS